MVVLARHGQTDWNLEHRWNGDPPLNDAGREQARTLAHVLAATRFEALYSSDLLRARETAEIVAERLGLDVQVEPSLREIDVGEWAGLTRAEIEQRYPSGYQRYLQGSPGWEQGERYEAMVARAGAALRSIAAAHPDRSVLVVTHAGFLCSTWIASGRQLGEWQGTGNGDLHQVAVEQDAIRWLGSLRADEDVSERSFFWLV